MNKHKSFREWMEATYGKNYMEDYSRMFPEEVPIRYHNEMMSHFLFMMGFDTLKKIIFEMIDDIEKTAGYILCYNHGTMFILGVSLSFYVPIFDAANYVTFICFSELHLQFITTG